MPESKGTKQVTNTRKRIWISVVGVLLVALFVAPQVLVWWNLGWAEEKLSEETGLSIQVESLAVGWFNSVRVKDLRVESTSGETVAQIAEIETEKSLIGLLLRGKDVGGITVKSPVINLPLEGALADELKDASEKIDPRKGLLGQIVNPDRAAALRLSVQSAQVNLRPTADDNWKPAVMDLNLTADIDHTPTLDSLDVRVEPTILALSPEVADYGLKFAAPVLAGAVDLDGTATLEVRKCTLQPQDWQKMEVEGSIEIEDAHANVQAGLLKAIAGVFVRHSETEELESGEQEPAEVLEDNDSVPMVLNIAQDSALEFSVSNQIIHHEGFSFGLPDLLPNVRLTSNGDVGFDESLDFEIGLTLPFEKMGDGGLLAKMGAPSLKLPVGGTFSEPEVGIGQGKLVGGLIRDLVDSVSNGAVDAEPFLQRLKEMDLLKNRSEPTDAEESTKSEDSPRRGVLQRLRDRLRGKDVTESLGGSKDSGSEAIDRE